MLAALVGTANESSFVDTLDKAVIPFIAVAATLVGVAATVVGVWFANNYQRQMKLRLADERRDAYSKLWEITGIGAPTRLDGWGSAGLLTPRERQAIHEALTDWYYANGNGMLLARTTRTVYLNAKHNLVCKDGHLRPGGLDKALPEDVDREQLRGILSIKQMSLLRTQLKSDLAIYGEPYYGKLDSLEAQFLWGSDVDLGSETWAKSAGRSHRFGWAIDWAHRKKEKEWEKARKDAAKKQEEREKEESEDWYNPSPILDAGEHKYVPSSSERWILEGKGEIPRDTGTQASNEPAARPDESGGPNSNV